MITFLYILVALVILGIILFAHGIRHAQLVDDKMPFLHGDYDPSKDPNVCAVHRSSNGEEVQDTH